MPEQTRREAPRSESALPTLAHQGNSLTPVTRTRYQRLPDRAFEPVDLLDCREFRVCNLRSRTQTSFYLTPDFHWLKDLKPDPHATGIVLRCNPMKWGLLEVQPVTVLEYFLRTRQIPPPEVVRAREAAAPAGPVTENPPPSEPGPATTSKARSRRFPRGQLDEHAAVELKKNPSLTYEQLANILSCSASGLRNRSKYPLVAAIKAKVRAEREHFRGGDTWCDRSADDDE
jgi:hypothetical protein